MSERFISPISSAELERRWDAARKVMARENLDALVLQNSNDWLGGYVRWFTGQPANNAYPRSVIFPREGKMTVVEQGGRGSVTTPAPDDTFNRGVARILHTPSYSAALSTVTDDAALAVGELKKLNCKRVGWVNPGGAYFAFGKYLEAAPGLGFVDCTDAIDQLKAIKSAEEMELIKKTTALQDAVMTAVAGFIKPGLHDFEVAAYAQYQSQLLGAEQGIFIGSSAPAGKAAVFRPRHAQGRKLAAGDVMALLVETNGPGGYYTEIGRTFVLGRANNTLKASLVDAVDAQARTLENLTPGRPCAEVFKLHNAYMRGKGFPEEIRLYSHGQGYDMVERPLIRDDETMKVAEGMSIVVHPGYINDEVFALVCDNYLIGASGPGPCLHKTPKQIFEL